MRKQAIVAAAAFAGWMCLAPDALAQTAPPKSDPAIDPIFTFTAPAALGDAWERAVQAVLEGMKAFLETDRAVAQQVIAPVPAHARAPVWFSAPVTKDTRAAREAVSLQPVKVEPPTQAAYDARADRMLLLGLSVELPHRTP